MRLWNGILVFVMGMRANTLSSTHQHLNKETLRKEINKRHCQVPCFVSFETRVAVSYELESTPIDSTLAKCVGVESMNPT